MQIGKLKEMTLRACLLYTSFYYLAIKMSVFLYRYLNKYALRFQCVDLYSNLTYISVCMALLNNSKKTMKT